MLLSIWRIFLGHGLKTVSTTLSCVTYRGTLGETRDIFLRIFRELYRVCRGGGRITITVPNSRHDDFLIDSTHVRAVATESFAMLSKANCQKWVEERTANTPLALYLDVDFEVIGTRLTLDELWRSRYATGEISHKDLASAIGRYMNVVKETTTILTPIKPGGRQAEALVRF